MRPEAGGQKVIAHSPSLKGVPVGVVSRFSDAVQPVFLFTEGQTYVGEQRVQRPGSRRLQRTPVEMHVEGDKLIITTKAGQTEERLLDGANTVSDLRVRRGKLVYQLDAIAGGQSDIIHSDEAEGLLDRTWRPDGYDQYDSSPYDR